MIVRVAKLISNSSSSSSISSVLGTELKDNDVSFLAGDNGGDRSQSQLCSSELLERVPLP